eukprot:tig00020675_g12601.t1
MPVPPTATEGQQRAPRTRRTGFPVPVDRLPFTPKDGEGIFHQGRGLTITFKPAGGGSKVSFPGSSYVSPRRIILVESLSQRRVPSTEPRRVFLVPLAAVEDERIAERMLSSPCIKFRAGPAAQPDCPVGSFKILLDPSSLARAPASLAVAKASFLKHFLTAPAPAGRARAQIVCNASERSRASNALYKLFFVLLSRLCEARFPPVLLPDEVEEELRAAAARAGKALGNVPPGHAEIWPSDDRSPAVGPRPSPPGSFSSLTLSPPSSFCRAASPAGADGSPGPAWAPFEPLTPARASGGGGGGGSRRGSLASVASSDAGEEPFSSLHGVPPRGGAVYPEPADEAPGPCLPPLGGFRRGRSGSLPANLPLNLAGFPPQLGGTGPRSPVSPPPPETRRGSGEGDCDGGGDRVPALPSFGPGAGGRRGSKPSVLESVLEEIKRPFRPRSSSSPAIFETALRPAAPGSRRVLVPMFDPERGLLEYVPQSFVPRRAAFADPVTGNVYLAEEEGFPDANVRQVAPGELPGLLQGRGAPPPAPAPGPGPASASASAPPPRQYCEADLKRMVTQMQQLCARYK